MMELLISWCVTSSILLAVFLLLRGTVFRTLSPRVRYALWGVVLLRLLVPFQIPSLSLPAAAADLAPELSTISERPIFPNTILVRPINPSVSLDEEDQADLPHSASTIESNLSEYYHFGGPTLSDGVQVVWAAGADMVLLAVLAANLRFAQKLRQSRRPLPTAGCPLPVYEAEELSSPCLCGVLRPAVYLTPEAAEDGTVRTHVLSHELTHFRHRDHIWSLLRCLALALHWYNPLVWAAVILSKRDGELACDEGTIARLGEAERIPYGRTLIGLVARRSGAGGVLSCSTTMTGGKKTVQRRIAQLVKQPETKKTALFLAAAALALAAVFVFAGGQRGQETVPSGDYSSLRSDIRSAQAIRLGQPLYSSYADPTQITDPDLLAQAKDLLDQIHDLMNFSDEMLEMDWQSAFSQSSPLTLWDDPQDETAFHTYYLWVDSSAGRTYVMDVDPEHFTEESCLPFASFGGNLLEQLEALQQEQRTLPQVQYRVEHATFKTQLTELFLNDPACVEQNASPDYDMEDWLTNWTTFYEVSYGVPWWDPEAPEGWYARAMDAGSWYSIAIPDHLADAVLEVCREAALCPSSEELYAALQGESPVCFTPSPTADFFYRISDRDIIAQISSLLLDEAVTGTDLSRSPGRVAAGESDCIISFARDGDTELHVYLAERDGGCLLACGSLGEDNEENASLPVLRVLPSGTSTAIRQAVDDWYARQPQSDSAPAD